MPRILIVDDERVLVETLAYCFEREGFEVVSAYDGRQALEMVRSEKPDLIILDVMLPKMDGLAVCQEVRRDTAIPILMLSARDSELDKVVGLEIGADDYITKPFSMRELVARVKATFRRMELQTSFPKAGADRSNQDAILSSNDIEVNTKRREVWRGGELLRLKPKEYDLLVFLLRHPAQAVTRDQLFEQVWGSDCVNGTRTIDVHVRWLREKIEDDPSHPIRLITLRSLGYKFEG